MWRRPKVDVNRALILILTLAQASSAQYAVQMYYGVDITHPRHDGAVTTPPYSTWQNGPSLGAIFDVPVHSPFFLSFSIDRTERIFNRYDHPLSGSFGYTGTSPSYGGDGVVWRVAFGPTVGGYIEQPIEYSIHLGAQTTYQAYSKVYYYFNGFIDEDPNAPSEHASSAPDPSSVYFGVTLRGTLSWKITESVGLAAGLIGSQNEHSGYYVRGIGGVLFTW